MYWSGVNSWPVHHKLWAPWGLCKNTETCRSNFNIDFIILTCASAGVIINNKRQNNLCTGWFKKMDWLLKSLWLYGTSTHAREFVAVFQVLSLLALRVDVRGLRSKLSWIRLTFFSDTCGRPELLPLHRQPVCLNWWFQRQMLFLVGGCWNED